MSDEVRGWRAWPPTLLLGFALDLALLIHGIATLPTVRSAMLGLAGARIAVSVLCGHGAIDLARRHTGTARRALRVAAAGWLVAPLYVVAWQVVRAFPATAVYDAWWINAVVYSSLVTALLPPIGLAIAMRTTRRWRTLAGFAIVLVVVASPFVRVLIWRVFAITQDSVWRFEQVMALARFGLIIALAAGLVGQVATPDPSRAGRGLRRAATAVRFRVIGAACTVASAWLVVGMRGELAGTTQWIAATGLVITIAACGWFAIGLFDATGAGNDLPRYPIALASAASLWCGGVMLAQLPHMLIRDAANADTSYSDALALELPIVGLVAIALVISAIATFAMRRSLHDLRRAVVRPGSWFVVIIAAGAVAPRLAFPVWDVDLSLPFLAVIGAVLVALWRIARLYSLAAAAVEGSNGLPAARAIIK